MAEVYRTKVAALQNALTDEVMRDEAFELNRSLVDKIVLMPDGDELRIQSMASSPESWRCASKAKRPAGAGRRLSE